MKETRFYEGFSFQEKYYRGWKASALKPISESQYEKDSNYYFPSSCRSASVPGFAPDGGHRCIASEIKKILTNPAKVSA